MQPESLTERDYFDLFACHVRNLTEHGSELRGLCPFHEDQNPSWAGNRDTGLWRCFGCSAHGNALQFAERIGEKERMGSEPLSRKIVATYDYTDEQRALLYQVVRFDPKDFRQRQPDGNGGWTWKLTGVRRVLYRLPDILDKSSVFLVEGEKDADRLWSIRVPATTCPQGAGKWRDEYNGSLTGKHVAILPDNDDVGEHHAKSVARSLFPTVASVKIVRLPGLPPKGDVSDWLDAGHTRDELIALAKAVPLLRPADLTIDHKPQSNRLLLTRLGDHLNEPEEHVSWLVDRLLPSGGFSLLVAKPKAGKSTLARNLALAIATGRDFLGKPVQQGPVIYLALEEKRSEVKKHFRDMGATGEEDIYVFAASAPVDALPQIRAVVEEKKPVLLIIDPLFRFTRVRDGNDYAQVTTALEPLLVLARETGVHVVCVHHAGKSDREGGDVILGSTAIFAAVDTALIMKRSERYRTISSQQRYGEDLPESVLRFDPATRIVSLDESKEAEEEKRIAETIIEFLKTKSEAVPELAIDAEVEGRRAVRKRALRALVEAKTVFRDGDGKRGSPFRYALDKSWFSSSQDIFGNQQRKNRCNLARRLPFCWFPRF